MKQCSKCKQSKNFEQFYKSSSSKDGHSGYCKECYNEYQRKKRGSRREYNKREFISETHKQCTQCREIKTFDKFAKNSGNSSGTHSWCKQCMSDKVLENRGGRVFKILEKTDTHKQCRLCEEMFDINEFSKRKNGYRTSYCKKCIAYLGHQNNIKRFSISTDEYVNMLKNQNFLCAICKKEDSKRLSIDHDHSCCNGSYSCGRCIRGLICFRCNTALGMVSDDTAILKSMIEYLL